jgi:hypothetical protein
VPQFPLTMLPITRIYLEPPVRCQSHATQTTHKLPSDISVGVLVGISLCQDTLLNSSRKVAEDFYAMLAPGGSTA